VVSTLPDAAVAPAATSRAHRRADIQGLRAVAVLAVVANHLTRRPAGGFVGVDVFFVISGFLITGLLSREFDRTGRISIAGFYRRRVRRLIPAASVVTVVTVLVAARLFPAPRLHSTVVDAVWATLFAANWRMIRTGTDYFAADLPPSPFHTTGRCRSRSSTTWCGRCCCSSPA
jgi:peptidoglycan/LPS O-acetylase OafA/YrhL